MLECPRWCCNVSGAMNSLHIHVQDHRIWRYTGISLWCSCCACQAAFSHPPMHYWMSFSCSLSRDCTRSYLLLVSSFSLTWFSITCVGCCVDPCNIASYCLLLLALVAAPSHCITLQHALYTFPVRSHTGARLGK